MAQKGNLQKAWVWTGQDHQYKRLTGNCAVYMCLSDQVHVCLQEITCRVLSLSPIMEKKQTWYWRNFQGKGFRMGWSIPVFQTIKG